MDDLVKQFLSQHCGNITKRFLINPIIKKFLINPNDKKLLEQIYNAILESKIDKFLLEGYQPAIRNTYLHDKVDTFLLYAENESFIFYNDKYYYLFVQFIKDLRKFTTKLTDFSYYRESSNDYNFLDKKFTKNDLNVLRIKTHKSFQRLCKICLKVIYSQSN